MVERSRPLAPAFDLPTRPGTVQDGVVLQAAPLQVGSAGFLRAGRRQRSGRDWLNSYETEVGTRESFPPSYQFGVGEHESLLRYLKQGPEREPFAPGPLVGEL